MANKSESEQERERTEAKAEAMRTAILAFMEERLLRNIPEELILEETAKIFLTIAEDEVKKKNRGTS